MRKPLFNKTYDRFNLVIYFGQGLLNFQQRDAPFLAIAYFPRNYKMRLIKNFFLTVGSHEEMGNVRLWRGALSQIKGLSRNAIPEHPLWL